MKCLNKVLDKLGYIKIICELSYSLSCINSINLYCAEADGCRVLDGITNIDFTSGFIEVCLYTFSIILLA